MGKCSKRRTMNGRWEPGSGRTMYTIGSVSKKHKWAGADLTTTINNIKRVQDNFVTPFSEQKYHLINNPFTAVEMIENDRNSDFTNGLLTDFMQKVITAANMASSLDMLYRSCKYETQELEDTIENLNKRIIELENMASNNSGQSGMGVTIKASLCAPGIPIVAFIANFNITLALYHLHFFKGWNDFIT